MATSESDVAVAEKATATPDAMAVRTARWVAVLFAITIVLQRFSLPGQPVALLLPVAFVWLFLAFRAGVVELDRTRLTLWSLAEVVTGAAILVQAIVLPQPVISINSWLLFTMVWAPCIARLADRRLDTYRLTLDYVVRILLVLAGVCIVMMLSQFAGLPYSDWVGNLVPANLQLQNYAISYPLSFGSPIYKSNAWIGLEPSFISFQLGVGVVAALLIRASWWKLLVLLVGLTTAASGSGFLIVLVAVVALLASPGRRVVIGYLAPAAIVGVVLSLTPLGQGLLDRTGELSSDQSSASLRSTLPYEQLWPTWTNGVLEAVLGRGPGSSQRVLLNTGIEGQLTPLPAKIFFDYGVVAGLVLTAFLLYCYLDGPSLSLAFTFFVSLWAIQPGNQPLVVLPVILLVTLWAPRHGRRLEDDLYPQRWSLRARSDRVVVGR